MPAACLIDTARQKIRKIPDCEQQRHGSRYAYDPPGILPVLFPLRIAVLIIRQPASILSVQHDIVPPTIHFKEAEEEMDLDYVPNLARKMQVNAALSNSLGFGGHNACLIFKKVK